MIALQVIYLGNKVLSLKFKGRIGVYKTLVEVQLRHLLRMLQLIS
jgi:hypothetical protein